MRLSKLSFYVSLFLILFVSACSNNKPSISVNILAAPDTVVQGTMHTLEAQVSNASNTSVIWTASQPDIITDINPEDNKILLFVPEGITGNITLTATSVENSGISDSVDVQVTAKQKNLHITFVNANSLLLTHAHDSANLAVQVMDEHGQVLPNAAVTFSSSRPNKVQVQADGAGVARVEALEAPAFSASITARYQDFVAVATVIVAEPHSQTRVISNAEFVSRTADTLVLQRNLHTTSFKVGDIVVADNQLGIMSRISQIAPHDDSISLTVSPASFDETFSRIDVSALGEETDISAQMLGNGYALLSTQSSSGSLSSQAVVSGVKCSTNNDTGINFDTEKPAIVLNADIRPEFKFRTGWFGGSKYFRLGVVAETGASFSTGGLILSSSVGGKVSCSVPIPTLKTPGLDMVFINLRLALSPQLGIEIGAVLTGPVLKLAGPSGGISATYATGIEYRPETGWQTYTNHNGEPTTSFLPFTAKLDIDFDFKAAITPFAGFDVGLIVDIGTPPAAITIVDVRFLELNSYMYFNAGINRPTYSDMPAYQGPQWAIGAGFYGKLKAELAGGAVYEFVKFLKMFGIHAKFSVSMDLFNLKKDYVASPQLSLSTSTSSITANQAVTLTATTSNAESYQGNVTFLGLKEGSERLVELSSGTFDGKTGSATWTPHATDAGNWQIYAQMHVDFISSAKGYAQLAPVALTVNN